MAMIDIGAQFSCTDGSDIEVIRPLKNELLEIFYDDSNMKDYFHIVEDFQIVLRVSGNGNNFNGGDGPERLSIHSRGKVIGIDFVIPENRWKNLNPKELREYLATGVNDCFNLLRKKAISIEQVKNLKKLDTDFKRGLTKFRQR